MFGQQVVIKIKQAVYLTFCRDQSCLNCLINTCSWQNVMLVPELTVVEELCLDLAVAELPKDVGGSGRYRRKAFPLSDDRLKLCGRS